MIKLWKQRKVWCRGLPSCVTEIIYDPRQMHLKSFSFFLCTKQKNWKQICVSKRVSHYLKHTKIESLVLKWIALGFHIIEWKFLAPGTNITLCMLTELKSYGVRMPPKWYPALKWSPIRPRNDPQLILGMEWYSATELLKVCGSVYVLKSHLTFHYSWCDILALLSSNRLYAYFYIFNINLKFSKVLKYHF